jgi:hypothetical protein
MRLTAKIYNKETGDIVDIWFRVKHIRNRTEVGPGKFEVNRMGGVTVASYGRTGFLTFARCRDNEEYDRKAGTMVCLQKIVWKHLSHDLYIEEFDSRFSKDGVIHVVVTKDKSVAFNWLHYSYQEEPA